MNEVFLPVLGNARRLGWIRDLPDYRDYQFSALRLPFSGGSREPLPLPLRVSNRKWCSPIADQGTLGSCTAHAGTNLAEYCENRLYGSFVEGSRLFLYKVTRKLMGLSGDSGADMRSTMKAMAMFGLPAEGYWPYRVARYETEPPAFVYAMGQAYKSVEYLRLDTADNMPAATLGSLKSVLATGWAAMLGFTCYSSLGNGPDIPWPGPRERVIGGHAIMIVGYDDTRKIGKETGALEIDNSWSVKWGDKGFGWLPYRYVLERQAVDIWTLTKQAWIDERRFVG